MPISIADVQTQHLFLLVGGNNLPNYVAAHLLATSETTLYLVHSNGTIEQRKALAKVLQPDGQPPQFKQTIDILVQEANPANIYQEVTKRLNKIDKDAYVGLHYTGGTKSMAVHTYRAVQAWQKEKSAHACYTYLDARSLHMWVERSDWNGAQALAVGKLVKTPFKTLLSLHRRDELKKPVRTTLIWSTVAQKLAEITVKEERRKQWTSGWNTYKKGNENEQLKALALVAVTEVITDTEVYQALQVDAGLASSATFSDLMQQSWFAKLDEPYREMVKWFTGGWLEDYVFLQLQRLMPKYDLDHLTMNIQPKLGNRDFEFDIIAMRWYQLLAFSCTLERGRDTAKQKLLEAVARARQLGGSEARIALVCCYDDAPDLQNEVEALVSENQVRVFGKSDLLKLQDKIAIWLCDLDRRSEKP